MNHFFVPIINTPNGVKATDKLNQVARKLEQDKFYRFIDDKNTGFELDFDARWAWLIKFNTKSGFIAVKELNNNLQVWLYLYDNDLKPTEFLIKDFDVKHSNRLINFIKECYKKI
jgi:hypothetical protein